MNLHGKLLEREEDIRILKGNVIENGKMLIEKMARIKALELEILVLKMYLSG